MKEQPENSLQRRGFDEMGGFDKLRLSRTAVAAAAAGAGIGVAGPAAGSSHSSSSSSSSTSTSFSTVTFGGVYYTSIGLNSTVGAPLTGLPGATGDYAYGLTDAALTASSRSDAFDGFGGISVNGVAFNQPNDEVDYSVTADGGFFTTVKPSDIDGILTSLDYFLDDSSPTMRVFATLTNDTEETEIVEVAYGGDLGSDDSTTIEETSSGDAEFDQATDRWLITSDGPSDSDPFLTFVRFGPGGQAPTSTPAVPSFPVFGNDGGVYGEIWELELDPGETQSLMMFVQLNDSLSNALAGTSDFDSLTAVQAAGLTVGLTPGQLSQTVNFAVPEPSGFMLAMAAIGTLAFTRVWKWFNGSS